MNELDLKPHGTLAAYRRHYRHGEKPCRACREANARRWQDTGQPRRTQHRREIRAMQAALDQSWAELEANGWRWPAWIGD